MHTFGSRYRLAVAVVATLIASPLAVRSAIADGGVPSLAGVGQHVSNASDVDTSASAADAATGGSDISGPIVGGGSSGALVINATFDASITGNGNAAAIEAMINQAVAIYENQFNDPIAVDI